ncbi:MAG: glycosyltransferase family 39 protein [Polymorphobacter sp.]
MAAEPVSRSEWLALAAILLLALVLRIIGLDAGLWYDEILTLTGFVRQPYGDLVGDFSSLNNHMLYSLQARASILAFGESAWALRLPAVLYGVASLVVLWLIGRQAAGRRAALLAVLLLAISYHHVWFSQNARGYTALLFWTSLATLLLARGLRTPRLGTFTAYGLCLAAALYTHLSAGFFFAAHGLVYAAVWWRGQRDWRPLYGFALGAGLTLLLHLPLYDQVLAAMAVVSSGKSSSAMAEWVDPLRTLREITASLDTLGPLAPLALAGALLLIGLGIHAMWRRAPTIVAVYVLSIPVALAILVGLDFRIWPRYFFVDIGFVFLCVAAGAVALADALALIFGGRRTAAGLLAAGTLVMIGASTLLLVRNYARPKQDFAGALALIDTRRGPGDVAASIGLASAPMQAYLRPGWPVIATSRDLDLPAGQPKWIVTAFDDHVEAGQEGAMAQIKAQYALAGRFDGTLGGGTVKVYRARSGDEQKETAR